LFENATINGFSRIKQKERGCRISDSLSLQQQLDEY